MMYQGAPSTSEAVLLEDSDSEPCLCQARCGRNAANACAYLIERPGQLRATDAELSMYKTLTYDDGGLPAGLFTHFREKRLLPLTWRMQRDVYSHAFDDDDVRV